MFKDPHNPGLIETTIAFAAWLAFVTVGCGAIGAVYWLFHWLSTVNRI